MYEDMLRVMISIFVNDDQYAFTFLLDYSEFKGTDSQNANLYFIYLFLN